jgi:hypothetical protein
VRRPLMLSLVPVALLAAAACSSGSKKSGTNDVDLQRDLKLASTSSLNMPRSRVDPANFRDLETAPHGTPDSAQHLKKAHGPDAVPSKTPELLAAPAQLVAATQNIPQVQTVATAPAPVPNLDPVATVPRPSVLTGNAAGAGDYGQSPDGGGIFGGMGPMGGPGVVIRGGGMGGDGDHCDPHGGVRPPIYFPPMGAGGGTRIPPRGPSRPGGRGGH